MEYKIKSAEIIDNASYQDEDGNYQPSEISVLVEIEVAGNLYSMDFQTTGTHDYGAYSSDLWPYDGTEDYESLYALFGDDREAEFKGFIETIKTESKCQQIWQNYVNGRYLLSSDHFDGMDANSEVNKMRLKD